MKLTEYRFPSATGIGDIYACAYKPDNGEYDIVLVIHHGMAEHQKRYLDFIRAGDAEGAFQRLVRSVNEYLNCLDEQ